MLARGAPVLARLESSMCGEVAPQRGAPQLVRAKRLGRGLKPSLQRGSTAALNDVAKRFSMLASRGSRGSK